MSKIPGQRHKAYSYVRFSSPEQAKGASKRRQLEAAKKWAGDHGMELDEDLRDEGISAFKGRNRDPTSALGKFLSRVRSGDVPRGSFLIIESFDRLSREQVVDALELFLSLTRDGITIVTLIDGHVYDRKSLSKDSTQLIFSIIIMSRAHEESATKSRRVGDAWGRKREIARTEKQAMTARCPGWLRLVGGPRRGHYELIPERADIVRRIFEDTIAGDGRRTISKRLNALGVELWGMGRSKGQYWHDSYVAKVLTSTATFGRYDKDDGQIAGYFPAAVTEETYWQAQAATASRNAGRGKVARNFNNLLTGLAKCSACGGTMAYVDKGKRSYPVLRCAAAYAGGDCTKKAAVRYSDLEMLVVYAYAHFADAAVFDVAGDVKAAQAAVAAIEIRKSEATARRDRLVAAIEEGVPVSAIRTKLDAVVVDLATVESELAAAMKLSVPQADDLEMDIEVRTDTIHDLIYAADPAQRYQGRSSVNARLKIFLDHLTIDEEGTIQYVFKPQFRSVTDDMLAIYDPGDATEDKRGTPSDAGLEQDSKQGPAASDPR